MLHAHLNETQRFKFLAKFKRMKRSMYYSIYGPNLILT